MKAAVERFLPDGGTATVVRSGNSGVRSFAVTFGGKSGRRAQPAITIENHFTGGGANLTVTETTPGVDGTGVGLAEQGAQYQDTTDGDLHVNNGTADAPSWVKVGTQT